MTVPTRFRRNSAIAEILVLHYADLDDAAIQSAQGFRVTRPLRTIIDVAEADTVERGFPWQAIRQAIERGMLTRSEIKRAKLSAPVQRLFHEALRKVA